MTRFYLTFTLAVIVAAADPRLPAVIGDHMVLQRERPVNIWGRADPGERIEVTLGPGPAQQTLTSPDGRWKVTLPSMRAGGPFTMTVRGGKTLTVHDVLIGEVWVLSGQSNMTFALNSAANADTAIPHADHPGIRLFTVPERNSLEPVDDISSSWQICTPDTARGFSAVGYFFGEELYRKLGVPIALIHTSWPGSSAEQWTPADKLQPDPLLQPILQHWNEAPADVRQLAREPAPFDLQFDDFELLRNGDGTDAVPLANFDDATCRTSFGGVCSFSWRPGEAVSFELASADKGYVARMFGKLGPSYSSTLRFPYRADGQPVDLSMYAGVRFRYRGAGQFRLQSLEPSTSDGDNYGTPVMRATADWQTATVLFSALRQFGWGVQLPFTPFRLTGLQLDVATVPGDVMMPPSGLYNGMVAPLLPFTIRGALWYQGESNTGRGFQYRALLPALIKGWREGWNQGAFPFLIVQLPNHGGGKPEPGDSEWAELREAELMTLHSVPDAGLAVTIDLGESDNIHPHDKVDVGHRLALWAEGTVYGQKLMYSGPQYESMSVEGSSIRLRFSNVGGGLAARGGGALKGFAIAGADRHFQWADATTDGNTVLVHALSVSAPVAVRYAWADNPDCNLINADNLPASPFRTDDWPGVTIDRR